ncbi:MAG: hypothetical protein ABW195_00900 [Ilumatobacteraceae bacterium]
MTRPAYTVTVRDPLVAMATGGADDVVALSEQLAADFPGVRFIGIIAATEPDDLEAALVALRPVLAEVIFTASADPEAVAGDVLAMYALEQLGMGQDFVFTVPLLTDATLYAIDVLMEGPTHGWEGTAVVVLDLS